MSLVLCMDCTENELMATLADDAALTLAAEAVVAADAKIVQHFATHGGVPAPLHVSLFASYSHAINSAITMLFGSNFQSDPQFKFICGSDLEGKARQTFMDRARRRWSIHLKQTEAGQAAVAKDDERKRMRKLSRFYC
jgi:hypothetical protein